MKQYPTLYKKTSTGATQIWRKEVLGNQHRTVSGQKDGAQVTSAWTTCTGKNIGKSNETTPERQAELEVEAAYTKKLAQGGYHETEDAIDEAKYFKPMLAKSWKDYRVSDFTRTAVWSQPKLDGIRCIATKDGLWTRTGKQITSCPHIEEELATYFEGNPDAIFDGELYADHLSDNFNEIVHLVKKQTATPEHTAKTAEAIKYHIYDFPSVGGMFNMRWSAIESLQVSWKNPQSIVFVETIRVDSQEHLDELNARYIEEGYEGQILRLYGPYKNGRSSELLKNKEFIDEEFVIESINEGKGNRAGIAGFITYKLPDGRTFGSGIKGNREYARNLLENADDYVGGTGTVRYFNLTPDGLPRFPVTVAVYPDGRDI
jgi:DNA ligase-1